MTLTRSTPLRRTPLQTAHFAAKPQKCLYCRKTFTPIRAGQSVHEDCAPAYGELLGIQRRKEAVKAERAQSRADKIKLHALKPLSWHKKQAQAAINKWVVHVRDRDLPCISCGAPARQGDQAGHYRTRGSSPHLALDPRNLARQCTRCNLHLHGNPIGYRNGLVERYGESHVAALEADQAPRHYTAADLDRIAAECRAKARALQKEMA